MLPQVWSKSHTSVCVCVCVDPLPPMHNPDPSSLSPFIPLVKLLLTNERARCYRGEHTEGRGINQVRVSLRPEYFILPQSPYIITLHCYIKFKLQFKQVFFFFF
jgi:hypothetical protein